MKLAIVDDESRWRFESLRVVKDNVDNEDEVDLYESGILLIQSGVEYDVILVDIEMPEMDGFETIEKYKSIHKDTIVIILTTHLELSRKGYLVDAFRYVDKTNMKEELNEAFEKIHQMNKRNNYYIVGKKDDIIKSILVKDVIYFETRPKGVIIHTQNNMYESDERINDLEEKLIEYDFFRCHKSFLVNMKSVQKIDRQFAYFTDSNKAYISVRKLGETKKKYIDVKKKYASM